MLRAIFSCYRNLIVRNIKQKCDFVNTGRLLLCVGGQRELDLTLEVKLTPSLLSSPAMNCLGPF